MAWIDKKSDYFSVSSAYRLGMVLRDLVEQGI